MHIETFYHPSTFTLSYVIHDPDSRDAVIIDPVLDYDARSSQTSTRSAAQIEAFVQRHGLRVHYILETHAHADHLSASQYLKRALNADVVIGQAITEVQETFKPLFGLEESFPVDGSQFDRLVRDGDTLGAGSLQVEVIATPGHTPACVTFKIEDAIFTGDALFIEDFGTGRCDFPKGSAEDLYDSIQKLYRLPDSTRVFVGHDYQPNGRALRAETTIGASKRNNVQLNAETSREDFIRFRTQRDRQLAAPNLLLQSVQVNIDAGRMPKPTSDERRYLRLPINLFRPGDDVGHTE